MALKKMTIEVVKDNEEDEISSDTVEQVDQYLDMLAHGVEAAIASQFPLLSAKIVIE